MGCVPAFGDRLVLTGQLSSALLGVTQGLDHPIAIIGSTLQGRRPDPAQRFRAGQLFLKLGELCAHFGEGPGRLGPLVRGFSQRRLRRGETLAIARLQGPDSSIFLRKRQRSSSGLQRPRGGSLCMITILISK